MKSRAKFLTTALAAGILLLLILDTKTAALGASAGVELCIKVIIPSLFPFFVVTSYLNDSLLGLHIPGLSAVGRLLKIPDGSDSFLLLGLMGGYPVGAQLITEAYTGDRLSRENSQIMLGYCSNAGPAFIFGVTSTLFSSHWIAFVIWGIHIFSALLTGFLLPRPKRADSFRCEMSDTSVTSALRKSLVICASVCGWVLIFKVILAYLQTWLTSLLSQKAMIFLTGLLELSNGCIQLAQIPSEAERFILCSAFLSFGGLCVLLQTASVTQGLGLGLYIPGKIMQTAVSTLTAAVLSFVLFPGAYSSFFRVTGLVILCVLVLAAARCYAEKRCGNSVKNIV